MSAKPPSKLLKLTKFGDPILRQTARVLSISDITNKHTQDLITRLKHTNQVKDLGVGIAAPQVGESIALAMIDIKPNDIHPDAETVQMIIINPKYEGIGKRSGMWEGCLSSGSKKNTLFGKALRFKKIKASWLDERGERHNRILDGTVAHVFQHETDHLNGILFVDRVRDSKTFMHVSEYRKRILKKGKR